MKNFLLLFSLTVVTCTKFEESDLSYASGEESQCPYDSIIDETGKYCCKSECGQCGGFGCHEFPGGEFNCCTSKFTKLCDDSEAPCVLSEGNDSSDTVVITSLCPAGSIINETKKYCCPEECGQCGGYGCHEFPGGEFNCCTSKFTNSCNEGDAPCIILDNPSQGKSCSQDGIIVEVTLFNDCIVAVCCPSSCEVCDTSEECTEPAECCAALIAKPVSISDVDVSCRDHDPPCVLPPEHDPCVDNPCQNGARCGYSWQGLVPYNFGICSDTFSKFVCACDEIGNYTGYLCERNCGEDGIPCGAEVSYGWYKPNDICCNSDEDCMEFPSKYNSYIECVSKNRPMACDPNPCLNDGSCLFNDTNNYYFCICPFGYEGLFCEIKFE